MNTSMTVSIPALVPALMWNPAAYLAAFLNFHESLPTALSTNLPPAIYNATAFSLANPVPVASYEYMAAFGDTLKLGHTAYNFSIVAVESITPEVSAWFFNYMAKPAHVAEVISYEHIELPVMLIGQPLYLEHLA